MTSRIPADSSYTWAYTHEPLLAPAPLSSARTALNEPGVQFIDDGTVDCVERHNLIRQAMSQVHARMYELLPAVNSMRKDYVAKFTGNDDLPREVYAAVHTDPDQNDLLISAGYWGPETLGNMIFAKVANTRQPFAPRSPEREPARPAPSSPGGYYDQMQAQRGDRAGQSSNPITPWSAPQNEPVGYRESWGQIVDQRLEGSSASSRLGAPNNVNLYNLAMQTALAAPNRPIREGVVEALHAIGLGAGAKRISPLIDATGRARRLPGATEEQMKEHLHRSDGSLKTTIEIANDLNAVGLGARTARIVSLLREANALK